MHPVAVTKLQRRHWFRAEGQSARGRLNFSAIQRTYSLLGISASSLMRRRCARLANEPICSGIVVSEGSSHNCCRKLGLAIPYSDVQTKEARNKDDNDHYADDVENVHCVLRLRYAQFQYENAALDSSSPARFGGQLTR
jgi:hypothetical protein